MKLRKLLTIILTASIMLTPTVSFAEEAPASNITVTEYDSNLILYKDSNHSIPYSFDDNIPIGSKVYYKIICNEGYFCYEFKVNAEEVTEEYFIVCEPTVECTVYNAMLGDVAGLSNILNLEDVTNLMRYIVGHKDVSTSAY